MEEKGTKQAKRVSPISGVAPPDGFEKYPERRHNGAWKKEDTARYKLEQMLKLTRAELMQVLEDEKASLFEKKLARLLLAEPDWKVVEGMMNQVYGQPKAVVENYNTEMKPLIDLTKRPKNGETEA